MYSSARGEPLTGEGYKMYEYTKEQWSEEMFGAKAAGCRTMTFDEWVEYRRTIDALFDELNDQAA
jgi:hypothetical protein